MRFVLSLYVQLALHYSIGGADCIDPSWGFQHTAHGMGLKLKTDTVLKSRRDVRDLCVFCPFGGVPQLLSNNPGFIFLFRMPRVKLAFLVILLM